MCNKAIAKKKASLGSKNHHSIKMEAISTVVQIRKELQTSIKIPKLSKTNTESRSVILCNWLLDLTEKISKLLKKFELTSNQTKPDVKFDDSNIIFHINITINQLFPSLFREAITAHSQQSYRKWLKYPVERKKKYLIGEIANHKKFNWTALYRSVYMNLLYHIIEKKVEKLCKGEYQTEFLIILRQWIDAHVLPYAIIILAQDRENCEFELSEKVVENNRNYDESNNKNNDNNNDYNNDISDALKLKNLLHNYVLSALSKFRAYELFEIVADYPESYMAIKELKEAANSSITGILSYIGKVFKEVVCKRLLHTGASTSQILDMYISMIRALRALDTSDLLLNFVAAPVRGYLLGREDTVRCVVASLTQAKDSDLHGELRRGGSLEYGDDEEDEEKGPGENWEPRKRDRDFSGEGVRGLDVLALLVSLYGSTDLFVTEYRSLLADKLLTNLLYNTDEELGTLELLKVRFGEEKLHSCEVMLRDSEESKRVNNAIACEIKKTHASKPSIDQLSISDNIDMEPSIIDCIMISDNYWPTLQNNEFTHHPLALEGITIYQETYTLLKKPRKLNISTQLGIVELELDFKDGSTRMFYAGPIQATLIMYLSEENINGYSSVELSEKCDVEEADVRRKMMFWISKGVVKEVQVDEDNVRYEVIEEQELNAQRDLEAISGGLVTGNDELIQDTIGGSAGVASEIQMKSIIIVFEKYVKGMLKSHDSMPLERIHAMLKLLASGGEGNEAKYDMNMVQLRKFMQTLIDRDELEYFDNLYRIRK